MQALHNMDMTTCQLDAVKACMHTSATGAVANPPAHHAARPPHHRLEKQSRVSARGRTVPPNMMPRYMHKTQEKRRAGRTSAPRAAAPASASSPPPAPPLLALSRDLWCACRALRPALGDGSLRLQISQCTSSHQLPGTVQDWHTSTGVHQHMCDEEPASRERSQALCRLCKASGIHSGGGTRTLQQKCSCMQSGGQPFAAWLGACTTYQVGWVWAGAPGWPRQLRSILQAGSAMLAATVAFSGLLYIQQQADTMSRSGPQLLYLQRLAASSPTDSSKCTV